MRKLLNVSFYVLIGAIVVFLLFLMVAVLFDLPELNHPLTSIAPLLLLALLLSGFLTMIVWYTKRTKRLLATTVTLLIMGILMVPVGREINSRIIDYDILPRTKSDSVVTEHDSEKEETTNSVSEEKYEKHQLEEITYLVPTSWILDKEESNPTIRTYSWAEGTLSIAHQEFHESMIVDLYNENKRVKPALDALAGTVMDGVNQLRTKREMVDVAGCPGISLSFVKREDGWDVEYLVQLFFSKTGLYYAYVAASSLEEHGLIGQLEHFMESISIKEEDRPLTLRQKVDIAKDNAVKITYAEYLRPKKNDNLLKNQYFIATGLASNIGRYATGAYRFDLFERSDSGFVTSQIHRSDGEFTLFRPKEGDGVNVIGLIDENSKCTIFLVEKAEVDYSLTDIIDNYKRNCASFDYKTIARDPHLYKGKEARFTGEVVQVMESGLSVVLRVNVTKVGNRYSDTVYVTYTKRDSQESRILEKDIVTLYGTLAGLKTYDTILGASITIPALEAQYIDIH